MTKHDRICGIGIAIMASMVLVCGIRLAKYTRDRRQDLNPGTGCAPILGEYETEAYDMDYRPWDVPMNADDQRLAIALCDLCDVRYPVVLALIERESGFNPDAVSEAGAIGYMQLMPGTVLWLRDYYGLDLGEDYLATASRPDVNLLLGIRLLEYLLDCERLGGYEDGREYAPALLAYANGISVAQDTLRAGIDLTELPVVYGILDRAQELEAAHGRTQPDPKDGLPRDTDAGKVGTVRWERMWQR